MHPEERIHNPRNRNSSDRTKRNSTPYDLISPKQTPQAGQLADRSQFQAVERRHAAIVRRAIVAKRQQALVYRLECRSLQFQRWPESAIGRINGEITNFAASLDPAVDPEVPGKHGCDADRTIITPVAHEPGECSPGRILEIEPVEARAVVQKPEISV
jgi:hypothetical protein